MWNRFVQEEGCPGIIFVISAPAGTGKNTLVNRLLQEFPHIAESISFTTRAPRPGEVDGHHYHFVSLEEFQARIESGDFLEHATLYGHSYGTSWSQVDRITKSGKHAVLVIDTQGAMELKSRVRAVYIFLAPPSLEELHNRLHRRRTESAEIVQERLEWAKHEMEQVENYDYCLVNDEVERAYDTLRSIIIAEEHKIYTSRGVKNG